jgi:nucleotidyltransferase/DNA polymerase involved in DNA repair
MFVRYDGGSALLRSNECLTSDCAICVWIPQFPLRAEELRRPDLIGTPTAILAVEDARRVWQVSSHARRQGVEVGMTVSQAIGLCATLTILEPDPIHYDEQFSTLLMALGNVSPIVEPVELGRVFVGVDGLQGLVGTAHKQLCVVHRAIQAGEGEKWKGVRLGWARGKFVAWVAASRAKPGMPSIIGDEQHHQFLRSQSVAVLPLEPDTYRRLWQLGLKTLGDLATLPEEAVTAQFGREGRIAWRLAAGLISEPVRGSVTPETIVVSFSFPLPIADRGLLSYAITKLIDRALHDPRRIGWRVHSIRLTATLEHRSSWLVDVTLKDPSASCQHLAAPLLVKLEQTPPAGAVEDLRVEFTTLVRGTTELQLFAQDAPSAARAGRRRALRWAAREIQKRMKQPMLHHIVEVDPWSRIPERRYALIDYDP